MHKKPVNTKPRVLARELATELKKVTGGGNPVMATGGLATGILPTSATIKTIRANSFQVAGAALPATLTRQCQVLSSLASQRMVTLMPLPRPSNEKEQK